MRFDNLSSIIGFHSGFHPPELMAHTHQHQEIEINFSPSGALTYMTGKGLVRVPKKHFAIFWAAAPHQVMAIESNKPFYWFTIPFAWMLQWKLPEAFMESLLQGLFFLGDEGPMDETACIQWRADIASGDKNNLHAAQLEVEAKIRRLVSRLPASFQPGTTSDLTRAPIAVQKMAEVIVREYVNPLTIAEIVRPTGLHPHYAMNLFRAICGVSILDYLTQHRLFHATRLLATTDMKILEVAFESGFGSQSRFYETFTRINGCSPRTLRQ
ncbi:MAG: helix-turn-helix domain-containing protein, partial [Chthoniobacterales bacterium]